MTRLYYKGKLVFFDARLEFQMFLHLKHKYPNTLVFVHNEWNRTFFVPYKELSWEGCEEES